MADAELWDPLRRKNVARTPEEEVRQWFIAVLRDTMAVPVHLMNSEVSMHYGGVRWRSDIQVFDREGKPLLTVECKRPDITLDGAVWDQVLRYHMAVPVPYVALTNGRKTFFARRDGECFTLLDHAPGFEEMLQGK